jgi:hypothetical protein
MKDTGVDPPSAGWVFFPEINKLLAICGVKGS